MFPTVINQMSSHYNQAYVLVEVNDIEQQVSDILNNEIEYENLLSTTCKSRRQVLVMSGTTLVFA